MPVTIKRVRGGMFYHGELGRVEHGESVDVSSGLAEYLTARHDFERVGDIETETESETTTADDSDDEAEDDDGAVEDEDAGGEDEDEDTCTTVKSDGDVCGRERPCPYHDNEGG